MSDKIKILIADDAKDTRESIKKILSREETIEILGEASNGEETLKLVSKTSPDVVLMDINMPVLDGLKATEKISYDFPNCGVIILSVQAEQEYFRKAMSAGAREYLVKPFSPDELINAIKRVKDFQDRRKVIVAPQATIAPPPAGKIIVVFGTKGGIGKSLIATNLAISLVQNSKKKVVIMDLDLQFGDIAIMLNINPERTISDVVNVIDDMDIEMLEGFLTKHKSGLSILPAPINPAYAETITPEIVGKLIKLLKDNYQYIIIDTVSSFQDNILTVLDICDIILLVLILDLPTIKNIKLSLETMMSLNYPIEKVKLVLNRSDSDTGLNLSDIEKMLEVKISYFIPSDGKLVIPSVNKGIPFVESSPHSPISEGILKIAQDLIGEKDIKKEEVGFKKFFKPIFAKR